MNRKALMISIGITAFVVVTVGGVIVSYAQSRSAASTDPPTVEDVLNDPSVQAVLQEREAAYQQMIEEANQRIAELSTPAEEMTAEEYPVSADLAAGLARISLGGGTLLRQPELVSVNGRAAYELIFDRGRVYIDATSGAILYTSSGASNLANSFNSNRDHDDEQGEFDD